MNPAFIVSLLAGSSGSRGRTQRAPPPPSVPILWFDIQILQNVAALGVGVEVGAPYGKSWICH